jgi:hypothetical protein
MEIVQREADVGGGQWSGLPEQMKEPMAGLSSPDAIESPFAAVTVSVGVGFDAGLGAEWSPSPVSRVPPAITATKAARTL